MKPIHHMERGGEEAEEDGVDIACKQPQLGANIRAVYILISFPF